jgi:polyphenol oxidase
MGFYKGADEIYRVDALDAFPWLVHGFGTRRSEIPRLFANLATLKQIHSSTCLSANGCAGQVGEGDALVENTPGAVVAVKTADCIPILLVDERLRAVAAVHAGWRGTAAGIAGQAVDAMRERFGASADDLHAAIGPGIGECCYEVGPEVAAAVARARPPWTTQGMAAGHAAHLNLAEENRLQLLEAGVTAGRIYASNLCTKCLSGDFHSFRRDREASGRLFSFAGVR